MRDSSTAPPEDSSARDSRDGRVERAPRPSGPRSLSVPRGQQPQQQGAGRPLPREALGNSRSKKADVVSPRREGLRDLRGQSPKAANPEQSASQAVAEAIGRSFTGRTGRPSGAEAQSPGSTLNSSAGSGATLNSGTQRAPLRPSPHTAQAQRSKLSPPHTPTQSQPYRGLNNTQPARTNSQSRTAQAKSASSRAASTDLEKRHGGSSANSSARGASGSALTSTAPRGGSSQIPMGLGPQRAGVAPGGPRQPPSAASQHRPSNMERDAPGRIRHESPGQSPLLQPRPGLTVPPRRASGISGPSTAGAGYASANPALRSPASTHRSTPLDEEMHSAQRNPSGSTIAPSSPQPRNAHRSLSPNASGASGASNTGVVGTSAPRPQQPLGVRAGRPSCVNHIPSTGSSPIPQAARTLPGGHLNTAPSGFSSPGSYARQLR